MREGGAINDMNKKQKGACMKKKKKSNRSARSSVAIEENDIVTSNVKNFPYLVAPCTRSPSYRQIRQRNLDRGWTSTRTASFLPPRAGLCTLATRHIRLVPFLPAKCTTESFEQHDLIFISTWFSYMRIVGFIL